MNDDVSISPDLDETVPAETAPEIWSPPTADDIQQMLPQFQVLELIGLGGMGAVYKALQRSLDRLVAIKVLPPLALSSDSAEFVERFRNEARLMARLNHPGIVTVHDFGETAAGHLYFIMEFVDGTDISKMIESQGRLPPEHALAITAHVCDALKYAHSHGVIHRDIKPANVLIKMNGEVKVADFGIAKVAGAHLGGLPEGNTTLGTPEYIAPEALQMGVEVDHRADIYSMGVMLYQMLTGQMPQGAYKPASQLVGCDARYDAIIARALQFDRELRYQSALEIRRDLDHIIITPVAKEGSNKPGTTMPRQPMHRKPTNAPASASRPSTSSYSRVPVKQGNSSAIWTAAAVFVLGVAGFLWWNGAHSGGGKSGNTTVTDHGINNTVDSGHSNKDPDKTPKKSNSSGAQKKSPVVTSPSAEDVANAFFNTPTRTEEPSSIDSSSKSTNPKTDLPAVHTNSGAGDSSPPGSWNVVYGGGKNSIEIIPRSPVFFGSECHDGAVRATIMANASGWEGLIIRSTNGAGYYSFTLKPTGKAVLGYHSNGKEKGEVIYQVDYDSKMRKEGYTFEFRAVGKKLTGLANGVEIISYEDDKLEGGNFGVIPGKNSDSFSEIAFMNFDKTNLPVISDSRLALLESQFHQAYERDIAKPRESLVADLDEKYIAALGRAEDAASRAGNSVELARLKEEKQRVQSKAPIPSAETEPLPASLKQLRATYADSIAKIDRDIDAKSSSLFNELDRQFGVLQQSLAMEHRDELVELIKVRRDQIAGKKLWH